MRFSKPWIGASFASLLFASSLHAATITPNTTEDPALGDNTVCSLRYAVESINTNAFVGNCSTVSVGTLGTDDAIALGAGTYVLELDGDEDNNQTGDLDVLANVAINGAGPDQTTVDASGIPSGDRAFQLTDSTSEVSISGLTVTGGNLPSGSGGGILADVDGTLTLDNIHVVDNVGAGIYIDFGSTVLINNATVDGNESDDCGGGIFMIVSTVGISNSTISNNESENAGGGICQIGDELFLTNTTISTNTAGGDGGGLFTESDDDSTLDTTTGLKGAYNVTIVLNEAGGSGGGIASDIELQPQGRDPSFPTRVFNSIIARNTATGTGNDCANGPFYSGGYNLIGEIGPNDLCEDFVNGVNGDQVGTPGSAIDPLIGPLQFNGGTTSGFTHALLDGSPAIDRGNPDGCQAADVQAFIDSGAETFAALTTDQRLLTRPVAILDPAVPICDIGAYELQVEEPTPTPTPIVTPTPPPFVGLIEGSGVGCSLATAAPASAQGFALLGLLASWGAWALRRRAR